MIVRWFYGELVVLDLSETGTQLGEKLSLLLDDKQQKELAHYLLGDMVSTIGTRKNLSNYNRQQKNPLTEIREGDLYICLEHRLVMIREQEIILTVSSVLFASTFDVPLLKYLRNCISCFKAPKEPSACILRFVLKRIPSSERIRSKSSFLCSKNVFAT